MLRKVVFPVTLKQGDILEVPTIQGTEKKLRITVLQTITFNSHEEMRLHCVNPHQTELLLEFIDIVN